MGQIFLRDSEAVAITLVQAAASLTCEAVVVVVFSLNGEFVRLHQLYINLRQVLKFYFNYVTVLYFCQRAFLFSSIPIHTCFRSVLKVIRALVCSVGIVVKLSLC